MADIRIYLSKQPSSQNYEIYRDGKATGEIIDLKVIRKMLTDDQYKSFIEGDTIFLVPGERFRTRNHKARKLPFGGKSIDLKL